MKPGETVVDIINTFFITMCLPLIAHQFVLQMEVVRRLHKSVLVNIVYTQPVVLVNIVEMNKNHSTLSEIYNIYVRRPLHLTVALRCSSTLFSQT